MSDNIQEDLFKGLQILGRLILELISIIFGKIDMIKVLKITQKGLPFNNLNRFSIAERFILGTIVLKSVILGLVWIDLDEVQNKIVLNLSYTSFSHPTR